MEVKYIHRETQHNTRAADIVVPEIMKLLKPTSVLDVGCGIGTWLHVFAKNGVTSIKGVDGDYVDKQLLNKYIAQTDFLAKDLLRPFSLGQKFDLVLSLEVAEHLPAESADDFVSSLVLHGDTILFSAAIPDQVGQNHLNEQWPDYWADKFLAHGYKAYDVIRPLIWTDARIDFWYRQNILLFSKSELPFQEARMLSVVLPEFWMQQRDRIKSKENQLKRIKEGKVGIGFYVKAIIKSLKYFGRKTV